jgi:hypothetical protein
MIGAGHPETKENGKALSKSGDDLSFSTDANMLYAHEGDQWICLGHVVPVHPKLDAKPYGDSMRSVGREGLNDLGVDLVNANASAATSARVLRGDHQ